MDDELLMDEAQMEASPDDTLGKGIPDEQIGTICAELLSTSLGGIDSQVSRDRLRNLEAFNAQPKGDFAPPEIEDRSDFVATDVADTIEWMLPQFMRFFVSTDKAVEFEARRPDAEAQAKMATEWVNHVFYVRNPGVEIAYDWFKDSLLQKVGFVKTFVEEDAEDCRQTFEGQTEDVLIQLLSEGWELESVTEPDEQGAISFTVVKVERKKCIKIESCSPDSIRVDANAKWGGDPEMIAHVFRKRQHELLEEGYDLSDMPTGSDYVASTQEELEQLGSSLDFDGTSPPHESHSLYSVAEVYIKLDRNGDGIAEWLKVCLIEEKLAYMANGDAAIEQVDGHPFTWICPIPRPHSFFGDCPADLAIQPQKLRTNVVRAIQDSLYLTVNPRTYLNMDAEVNMADWLDNRPGGAVRGRGPAAQAIQPLVTPSLTPPAYQFNEWLETWKENRTGFTRYSQGADADSLNKTATGVSIITQKSDMRIELMARFFAVGMRQLFAKILKLSVQHMDQPEWIKLSGGEWAEVSPSEWKDQFNVKINVGLGTGSKEQQAQRVMALLQTQLQAAPFGVISPQAIAQTVKLFAESQEFTQPERFVSPEPTGMPANPQAYQQEKQQVTQQLEQMAQQIQQLGQENQALKLDSENKQQENLLKAAQVEQSGMKLQLEGAKAMADHDMRAQGMHNEQAEGQKTAQLEAQVNQLAQVVQALVDMIAPQQEPMNG